MDPDLVRRAMSGNEAALGELYECCYGPIYRYVSYRVRDTPAAEELTSEVFVRMVIGIGSYRDRGRPFLAWLYTIARNLVTDYRRRQGRYEPVPLGEAYEASDDHSPTRQAERQQTRDQLAAALDQLTEDQRQVILLKFVEAMSNAEVAAILGKGEGSVKSLQHRALAALRKVLGDHL
jgi:RNA polymerase sigma-70 factor, ECF subfamily